VTLGSPIALQVANRDHASWQAAMSPWPTSELQGNWRDHAHHVPRPGHADLGGIARGAFHAEGLRPVLERASARETAARVAAGAIMQTMLAQLGIRVRAHVRSVGGERSLIETPDELDPRWSELDVRQLRVVDAADDVRLAAVVDDARARRTTLGGEIEVIAWGVPPGVGGYVTARERLDGRLAGALMAVHAMKFVAIGDALTSAAQSGELVHDELHPVATCRADAAPGDVGGDQGMGVTRLTNRGGGIEGGMTTGAPIVVRVGMKPLATLMQPLQTVDLATGEAHVAHAERSDVCAIAAAAVACETAVALELATVLREQHGAQAFVDVAAAFEAYRERVRYPLRAPVALA
jgi:chorismate synthase